MIILSSNFIIYIYIYIYICYNIALPKFNLFLIDTITCLSPPGPYRATTCRERELTLDHMHTSLTTQGHGGSSPDEGSSQCRGHLQDNANMKDNTHQAHTQSSQQGGYGMIIMTAK